jgi:hypothetical protein
VKASGFWRGRTRLTFSKPLWLDDWPALDHAIDASVTQTVLALDEELAWHLRVY